MKEIMKSRCYFLVAIVAMILSVQSCKENIKIELTPSCLIALSNLKTDDVIKNLSTDSWTRRSGVYTDYTYSKAGINGVIELRYIKGSEEKKIWFTTESDSLYKQWYMELEKLGYTFKDVSKFKGLQELRCKSESKDKPVIILKIGEIYSDAAGVNIIGHSYSMFVESISDNPVQ